VKTTSGFSAAMSFANSSYRAAVTSVAPSVWVAKSGRA
jgi:hypothetical protein